MDIEVGKQFLDDFKNQDNDKKSPRDFSKFQYST